MECSNTGTANGQAATQTSSLLLPGPLRGTTAVEVIGPLEQLHSHMAEVREEALMLADNSHSFFRLNMRCCVI